MLGTIINTGLIITLFAIAAPFVFVLLVIRIMTGSPNHRRRNSRRNSNDSHDDINEEMDEISKGLKDLKRRIDNLETLKNYKQNKER